MISYSFKCCEYRYNHATRCSINSNEFSRNEMRSDHRLVLSQFHRQIYLSWQQHQHRPPQNQFKRACAFWLNVVTCASLLTTLLLSDPFFFLLLLLFFFASNIFSSNTTWMPTKIDLLVEIITYYLKLLAIFACVYRDKIPWLRVLLLGLRFIFGCAHITHWRFLIN